MQAVQDVITIIYSVH